MGSKTAPFLISRECSGQTFLLPSTGIEERAGLRAGQLQPDDHVQRPAHNYHSQNKAFEGTGLKERGNLPNSDPLPLGHVEIPVLPRQKNKIPEGQLFEPTYFRDLLPFDSSLFF